MQISCHAPLIFYISILLNMTNFLEQLVIFYVRIFTQMWSPTICCKLYKGKKERHLKICQKPKALI
jgi:hypothetical protein